jgi:chaperonin GroES
MTKVIPLDDRVLAIVEKTEKKTAGGIILPDSTKDRQDMAQLEATIVSMGEAAYEDLNVKPKPGDRVLISKHAGLIYFIDEVEHRLLNSGDIVGVIFSDEEYADEMKRIVEKESLLEQRVADLERLVNI